MPERTGRRVTDEAKLALVSELLFEVVKTRTNPEISEETGVSRSKTSALTRAVRMGNELIISPSTYHKIIKAYGGNIVTGEPAIDQNPPLPQAQVPDSVRGVLEFAKKAHRSMKTATKDLRMCANNSPAIAAHGFNHVADQIEKLSKHYLEPLL